MARWGVRFGRWWLLQWALDGTFSIGLHVDPLRRPWRGSHSYGPYIDLHLGPIVVSIGNHPARAGEWELLRSTAIMRPDFGE